MSYGFASRSPSDAFVFSHEPASQNTANTMWMKGQQHNYRVDQSLRKPVIMGNANYGQGHYGAPLAVQQMPMVNANYGQDQYGNYGQGQYGGSLAMQQILVRNANYGHGQYGGSHGMQQMPMGTANYGQGQYGPGIQQMPIVTNGQTLPWVSYAAQAVPPGVNSSTGLIPPVYNVHAQGMAHGVNRPAPVIPTVADLHAQLLQSGYNASVPGIPAAFREPAYATHPYQDTPLSNQHVGNVGTTANGQSVQYYGPFGSGNFVPAIQDTSVNKLPLSHHAHSQPSDVVLPQSITNSETCSSFTNTNTITSSNGSHEAIVGGSSELPLPPVVRYTMVDQFGRELRYANEGFKVIGRRVDSASEGTSTSFQTYISSDETSSDGIRHHAQSTSSNLRDADNADAAPPSSSASLPAVHAESGFLIDPFVDGEVIKPFTAEQLKKAAESAYTKLKFPMHWAFEVEKGNRTGARNATHPAHGHVTIRHCQGIFVCPVPDCKFQARPATTAEGRECQSERKCKLHHRTLFKMDCDVFQRITKWAGGEIFEAHGHHKHPRPRQLKHLTTTENERFESIMKANPKATTASLWSGEPGPLGASQPMYEISSILINPDRIEYQSRALKEKHKKKGKKNLSAMEQSFEEFKHFEDKHPGFVLKASLISPIVIVLQTAFMLARLVENFHPEKTGLGISGIATDAAHKFFANRDIVLIVSSVFCHILDRWIPVLITISMGQTSEHYEEHFYNLISRVYNYCKENGLVYDDKLLGMVCVFVYVPHHAMLTV